MEPAEEIFNRFRERGVDEIRELVQRKQEETIFLEFKRKSHPTKAVLNDDDKKNYSVALSGFANSEGGVIVWGVKAVKLDPELPDVATELFPITNSQAFMSNLNSLTGEAVIPRVEGVENFHIADTGSNEPKGYVVTHVPKTALIGTAHRAEIKGTKHYFKRSGDSFYAMEHYELMDVMARVKHPDVTASVELVKTSFTTPGRWDFTLQVTLANRGAIPAVDIYLELYVPYNLREGITKFPQIRSKKLDGKDYRVYAYHHRDATGPLPLFPGVDYPIMDGNNRYVNLKLESALPLEDLKNEYISWTVYADRSEAKRYRTSAADLCRVI